MRTILFSLGIFLLFGCGTEQVIEPEDSPSFTIKASGVTGQVTLLETISRTRLVISTDGDHPVNLANDRGIYHLEVVDSQSQYCTLNDALELECSGLACTMDYRPVCAKKFLANMVCVTTPCETDQYQTFSNSCVAMGSYGREVFDSECQALEGQATEFMDPVSSANLAVISVMTDPFSILDSSIQGDVLSLSIQVSGGCGFHDVNMVVNDEFYESLSSAIPVQLNHVIIYQNNDLCEAVIEIEKQFDLKPVKQLFNRQFPDRTGEQEVEFQGLGVYRFTVN